MNAPRAAALFLVGLLLLVASACGEGYGDEPAPPASSESAAASSAPVPAGEARDLKQRPAELVRGPKALWGPAMSVQPIGPIAYLVWGRKR